MSTETKGRQKPTKSTTLASAKKSRKKKKRAVGKQLASSSRPQKQQAVKSKKYRASVKKKKQRPVSRKSSSKRFKRSRRIGLQLLLSLFLTIGLIWLLSLVTFTFHRVDSYMMTPTLTNRDVVFVNKQKAIRRFDLVLLKNPTDKSYVVRRVIGVGGDQLSYKNDQLYLNNQEQVERFLSERLEEAHQNGLLLTEDFSLKQVTGESQIPKGKYFVLGDNRQYVSDSRHYGLIDEEEIVGVVQLRIFPLHEMQYL